MKKIFCIALALFSALASATTTVPVQLLNPIGSTSGQAIVSTGSSSAPAWGSVAAASIAGSTQYAITVGTGTGLGFVSPGASGGVLVSNGSSAYPSFQTLGGRLIGVQVIMTTGTYTPDAGTNSIIAKCVGGGGAGGGSAATSTAQNSFGSGGASGSYTVGRFTSSFSGVTVTIGAAGAGVSGGTGGAGGQTSFGALLIAPGGNGGTASSALANTATAAVFGGAPGAATTGGNIINAAGNPGGNGISVTGNPLAGIGAASPFGGGGMPAFGANGGAATGNGAGGAGSSAGASAGALAGGAGSKGMCEIDEYN